MNNKIFELVAFNGRNGYRAVDRIRRKIAYLLSDTDLEFFSITNPKKSFAEIKDEPISYLTNHSIIEKLNWKLRILKSSLVNNYDIYHSLAEKFTLPILRLLKKKNKHIKHLFTVHGLPFEGAKFGDRIIKPRKEVISMIKLYSKIIKKADLVTEVSKISCKKVEEKFNVECELMPDGVDTNFFKPYNKKIKTCKIRFLYVGSFQPRKNVLTAIDIAKQFPEIDIVLIGRGHDYLKLYDASKKYPNLKIITSFLSNQALLDWYNKCDVFFFPSLSEGLANVLLEAISSGLPVLASNYTSNPELVIEGFNGYLFNNKKEMIEKVSYFQENNELKKMGQNSRKLSLNYDWSKIAKIHYKIFKKLL